MNLILTNDFFFVNGRAFCINKQNGLLFWSPGLLMHRTQIQTSGILMDFVLKVAVITSSNSEITIRLKTVFTGRQVLLH